MLLVPVALLLLALDVVGDSPCPTAREVAARLQPLLPAGASAETAHRVTIARGEAAVVIELRDGEGMVLASRRLAANASCADLAAAAAVVIATWEVELRGQGALNLVLPAAPEPPTGPALSVALGVFASRAGSSLGPAAEIELAVGPRAARWQAFAALGGVGDHRVPLGQGAARWQRTSLAVGGRITAAGENLFAGAGLTGLVSLLRLAGEDFPTNRSDGAADLGVGAQLRFGFKYGGVSAWLGGTLDFWPVERELRTSGLPAVAQVPSFELLVGSGVTFVLR